MKILVAGGAGFLGSYTCESLLKLGHEVIALDNLYTGNIDNVNHLLHYPSFKFITHDITIPIDLEVDGIINMACPASPKNYQKIQCKRLKQIFMVQLICWIKQNGIIQEFYKLQPQKFTEIQKLCLKSKHTGVT